jgi:ABC-2 type transport system ATP-binding protein
VTALVVEGLSHDFGRRHALRDVGFTVEPGTFTVLLGPNGAGKTTLLSLVTGLYSARRGDIWILGHSLRKEPLMGLAKLGVVFQHPTLDLDLTVGENLLYHAALHGLSRQQARERSIRELDRLGILDRAADKVRVLSGGLRRRVEIARALLHEPQLLVVDEATVGLDVAMRRALVQYVRTLCHDRSLSVLWATHMLDEVGPHDPLIVLHEGAVCWSGPAGDLSRAGENLSDAFLKLTGQAA